MNISECYYKTHQYKEGKEILDQILIEKLTEPSQYYLLMGKYLDIEGKFEESQQMFKKALDNCDKDESINVFLQQNSQLGNIQFRYGWALVRSKVDVNEGIDLLKQAELNMPNNYDLKMKLAQILY